MSDEPNKLIDTVEEGEAAAANLQSARDLCEESPGEVTAEKLSDAEEELLQWQSFFDGSDSMSHREQAFSEKIDTALELLESPQENADELASIFDDVFKMTVTYSAVIHALGGDDNPPAEDPSYY